MKTIFLTGFMAAGKTTVGKELGKRLSLAVIDTDEIIEQLCKKSIGAIFEEEGEAAFRKYERKVLQSVAWKGVIVTTGGGVVLDESNRQFMRDNGIVIYLHADPKEIIQRVSNDRTRPLLKDDKTNRIVTLLEERMPYYLDADYAVNTMGKSVDTVVDEISGFLYRQNRFWA
ncbi:MAG: shikimate kinase [Tuberibacillus sp.]